MCVDLPITAAKPVHPNTIIHVVSLAKVGFVPRPVLPGCEVGLSDILVLFVRALTRL